MAVYMAKNGKDDKYLKILLNIWHCVDDSDCKWSVYLYNKKK